MSASKKDIRLEIKARNNLILSRMEDLGIESVSELAGRVGMTPSALGRYVNMQLSARRPDGDWRTGALKIAKFFRCLPNDIFSDPQQHRALKKNRVMAEVAFEEMRTLLDPRAEPSPLAIAQAKDLRSLIGEYLHKLSPRVERIIRERFGFNGPEKTLEEGGAELGISEDRVRMLEAEGLLALRRYGRGKKLLNNGALDDEITDALRFVD